MALSMGTGPFGTQAAGIFNFEVTTGHVLYFEDSPRWVRVVFNGETIADSRRAKLLHETGHLPSTTSRSGTSVGISSPPPTTIRTAG